MPKKKTVTHTVTHTDDARVPKGVTVVHRYEPDLQRQVDALLLVFGYSHTHSQPPDTPGEPAPAPASASIKNPKPSARTKRLLARLLKEQRAPQTDSATEEADA